MSKRRNSRVAVGALLETPPAKKNKKHNWTEIQTFDNEADEAEYFQTNTFWKIRTRDAQRTIYYCNVVSLRKGPCCPAQICVIKKGIVGNNKLCSNTEEHNHELPGQVLTKQGVSENIQREIKEKVYQNVKPRKISADLRQNHQQFPSQGQVCNILSKFDIYA